MVKFSSRLQLKIKLLFNQSLILSLLNDIVHDEVALLRHHGLRLGKNETARDKWEESKREHLGLDLVS